MSDTDIKKYEREVFYVTRMYHLASFIVILLIIELKRWKWFIWGQGLQSLFITGSMFMFSYVIYIVKMNFGTWDYEMNYIRAWLLIEVMFFFNWIVSGIIFLILSKMVKFHPITSDEAVLEADQDVWNDRTTQDFIVHLKTEFFHFCYMCSIFMQTVGIGFTNFYFMGVFGPRDFNPTMQIISLITVHRFWTLFSQLVAFHKGEHVRSNEGWIKTAITIVFHLAVTGVTIWLYHKSKYLEGQNIFCQLWVLCVCIILIIEPFFFLIRISANKKFNELAHKAALEGDYAKVRELEAGEEGFEDAKAKADEAVAAVTGAVDNITGTKGKKPNPLDELGSTLLHQETKNLSKSLKQQKLEKKLSSKKFLEYNEDFVSLTVLAYLKANIKDWSIVPEKRGQMLYSALSV